MVNFLIDPQYTYYVPVSLGSATGVSGNNGVNGNNSVTGNKGVNNNGNANNNGNNNGVNNQGNTGDVVAPASDDYRTQFNTKLGLIKKYCDNYIVLDKDGNEIDVNKIRTDYINKPEEGVKYCDELIKTFDQNKVEKMVRTEYKNRVEANKENGEKVANEWVKQILESGTTAAKINTSGVNANNILDVIGGFVTNEDVKDGKVSLSQLFEDPATAENLVSALKSKAQDFIKRTDLDSTIKESIIAQTNALVDAKYEYSNADTDKVKTYRDALVDKYMKLFETIRVEQAKLNDAAAPQYYGLPSDTTVTFSNETDRANEEVQAHKSRKRLNTNI